MKTIAHNGRRRNRWSARAGVVGVVAVAASVIGMAPAVADAWTDVGDGVDQLVTNAVAPGAGIVVWQYGSPVYSHAAGTDAGTPNGSTPPGPWSVTTPEPIGSSTKIASATVLMRLVSTHPDLGNGQTLQLSTKVVDVLPGFDDSDPAKSVITLGQLLTHTSGLPTDSEFAKYESDHNRPNCMSLSNANPNVTLAQCVAQIANAPLSYAPGTMFGYTGTDYEVAGFMAMVIVGTNWVNVFNAALGTPCGLNWTWNSITNPLIGGGGVADSASVLQVMEIQRTGGVCTTYDPNTGFPTDHNILSPQYIHVMQQDYTSSLPTYFSPRPTAYAASYGIGLWREFVGQGGKAVVVSSPGAFGNYPWVALDYDYSANLSMYVPSDLDKDAVYAAFHDLDDLIMTALGV